MTGSSIFFRPPQRRSPVERALATAPEYNEIPTHKRRHVRLALILFGLTAFLVMAFDYPPLKNEGGRYLLVFTHPQSALRLDTPADRDYCARTDFSFVDSTETEEVQNRVRQRIAGIYNRDNEGLQRAEERLRRFFRDLAEKRIAATSPRAEENALKEPFRLGDQVLSPLDVAPLWKNISSMNVEDLIERRLKGFFDTLRQTGLMNFSDYKREAEKRNPEQLNDHTSASPEVIKITEGRDNEIRDRLKFVDIHILEEQGENRRLRLKESPAFKAAMKDLDPKFISAMERLLVENLLLSPTLTLNEPASRIEQDRAAAQKEPVVRQRKKGDLIVYQGSRVTQKILDQTHAEQARYYTLEGEQMPLFAWAAAGIALWVALILWPAGLALKKTFSIFRSRHAFYLYLGLNFLMLVLARLFNAYGIDPAFLPLALIGILSALAFHKSAALYGLIFQLMSLVVIFGSDQSLILLAPTGSALLAIYSIAIIERRGATISIGFWIATTLFFGALGAALIAPTAQDAAFQAPNLLPLLHIPALAAGIVLLEMAALGIVLPHIERFLNITTGMTLLRLTDPNAPVLKQLARVAPGTFVHSLNVGALCEQAATAIGANSLLARVGAYYHDIGKITHPEFFAENQDQSREKTPHAELPASMSSLIIRSHPKDGLEICKNQGLPHILQQFILEHHGTMKIEYFYKKAQEKALEKSGSGEVSETEFRYGGPKPRSAESAILMLADMAESASRSTDDPNPTVFQRLIHSGIVARFLDGQFSECCMTTHQLELIEKALVDGIMRLKHQRPRYPGQNAIEQTPYTPSSLRSESSMARRVTTEIISPIGKTPLTTPLTEKLSGETPTQEKP